MFYIVQGKTFSPAAHIDLFPSWRADVQIGSFIEIIVIAFQEQKGKGKRRKEKKIEQQNTTGTNFPLQRKHWIMTEFCHSRSNMASIFSSLSKALAISCQFFPLLRCHCQSIEARFRRKFESKQTKRQFFDDGANNFSHSTHFCCSPFSNWKKEGERKLN